MRVSGRIGGSRMADEIAYVRDAESSSFTLAGRWNALLQWNDNGVTRWTGVSHVTDVSYSRDDATDIGTVTIRAEGYSKTSQSLDARHASPVTGDGEGAVAFAITDRLSLAPDSSDILVEIVKLENIGAEPINVEYLFLRPLAAEEKPKPCRSTTVPNLWKGPVEGWWQLSDGSRWGVTSSDPGVMSAVMWFRKEDATQHPDIRCLGVPSFTLPIGEIWTPSVSIGAQLSKEP